MTKKNIEDLWKRGEIWTFTQTGDIVAEKNTAHFSAQKELREKEYPQKKLFCVEPTQETESIDATLERKSVRTKQPLSLMARAVGLLAKREYSYQTLRTTLSRYVQSREDIHTLDRVLEQLQEKGYLSNKRFAQVRTQTRLRQYGNRRIAQELRRNGIDESLIHETMKEFGQEEETRCREIWKRKFGRQPETPKERDKQIRYFLYRGFSYRVIQKVITTSYFDEELYF